MLHACTDVLCGGSELATCASSSCEELGIAAWTADFFLSDVNEMSDNRVIKCSSNALGRKAYVQQQAHLK